MFFRFEIKNSKNKGVFFFRAIVHNKLISNILAVKVGSLRQAKWRHWESNQEPLDSICNEFINNCNPRVRINVS